jgi:hypothetical protein
MTGDDLSCHMERMGEKRNGCEFRSGKHKGRSSLQCVNAERMRF